MPGATEAPLAFLVVVNGVSVSFVGEPIILLLFWSEGKSEAWA